jgi:hypothetical protein
MAANYFFFKWLRENVREMDTPSALKIVGKRHGGQSLGFLVLLPMSVYFPNSGEETADEARDSSLCLE